MVFFVACIDQCIAGITDEDFGGTLKVLALFIIAAPGVVAAKLHPDLQHGDDACVRLLVDVMPVRLAGLCLAAFLAAIKSSVDSRLLAASSLLAFEFIRKRFRGLRERSFVRLGRTLILILLPLNIFWAPFIRNFEGLFEYPIKIWTLTAPSVFACIVFGLFYRLADARSALTTLIAGTALGAATFAVIRAESLSTVRSLLGPYLSNKLNARFVIPLICAAVLLGVSPATGSTAADLAKSDVVFHSRSTEIMARRKRNIYRMALAGLLLVWIAVLITFSPLGFGR